MLSQWHQGYKQVLALPVDKRQPGESEQAFWLRRQEIIIGGLEALPFSATVAVVDGTDVLWTAGPASLLERYREVGHDVVYAAEMLCDTPSCRLNASLATFMSEHALRHKMYAPSAFLNAGCVLGKTRALEPLFRRVLGWMRATGEDDQASLVQLWRLDPSILALDYDGSIFAVVPPTFALFAQQWKLRKERREGAHTDSHGTPTTEPTALNDSTQSLRQGPLHELPLNRSPRPTMPLMSLSTV